MKLTGRVKGGRALGERGFRRASSKSPRIFFWVMGRKREQTTINVLVRDQDGGRPIARVEVC